MLSSMEDWRKEAEKMHKWLVTIQGESQPREVVASMYRFTGTNDFIEFVDGSGQVQAFRSRDVLEIKRG